MSFRRKDSLINHSAIHSMVNLRCVICNTSFETAKMVKEHITTHLTGLPFPCEKCDYSFDTSDQLEEHELKHAEMEYEEQIEQEVISEARQQQEENTEDEEFEEGEVTEYTIPDINNPEVIPRPKPQEPSSSYAQFLKDELGSDLEDSEAAPRKNEEEFAQPQESAEEPLEPIKPIIRQEGTKVYKRKAPVVRKIPQIIQKPAKPTPEPASQAETAPIDCGVQSSQTINALPNKNILNMKLGDKFVRVQKFIVTKEEMKAMAKQGILEMKGGQVVLKNPGQPILNATLKPVQKIDIECLLDKKSNMRKQIKQYQRRAGPEQSGDDEGSAPSNQQQESIDLDENFPTTLQRE